MAQRKHTFDEVEAFKRELMAVCEKYGLSLSPISDGNDGDGYRLDIIPAYDPFPIESASIHHNLWREIKKT
jgi:hypothetical protein